MANCCRQLFKYVRLLLTPAHHGVSENVGDPGPTPQSMIPDVKGPLILLWGLKDPFTPIDGPVARYFRNLATIRPHTVFEELEGSWFGMGGTYSAVYKLQAVKLHTDL